MAHDFHLEELGPRAFEQLAVALATAAFGAGVEAYGSGKDGGREGTFHGRINWTSSGEGPAWNGYTVIQAKQCERILSPSDGLTWLKGQVRNEFNTWMDPASTRDRLPNNLLFVTNARLSAETGGGVDQINAYLKEQINRNHGTDSHPRTPQSRGLRNAKVWHRDTLNSFISNNQSIRHAFPAILTIGDILSLLKVLPGYIQTNHFDQVLRGHGRSALRYERWIRFGESGGSGRQSIEKVVVDLPAKYASRRKSILRECIARGEHVLRKSVWNSPLPRHIVVTGAPGNGKSTITTYLTQMYRANFIRNESGHESTIASLVRDTSTSLSRLNLEPPRSARWPLRIALSEMAEEMGPEGGPSLMRWLCQQISERASYDVQPANLRAWLNAWPSVLIFDGLDEVTAPSLRSRVIDEITELIEDADDADADLMVIVTTRPTGYTERLMPEHFSQIDLDYLTTQEAIVYGQHITMQRLHDDLVQCDRLLSRFKKAAQDAAAERLLKTPLQVLILTYILEGVGDLPTNRYELFWGYFDTIFRREAEKRTTHQQFLREHRDNITELHERVGLTLQVQCEGTDETRARLSRDRLRTLASERMIEVGYEDIESVEQLSDKILEVATQRLVLLVADENETVSFEVRSLQESMAARALVSGDDHNIRQNLNLTAPSPHWRNTWLFAAGKLFTESDHRRSLVLDVIERFDQDSTWHGWLYPIGPELASHMLDDGLAATKPAAQRKLVQIALRSLHGPMPQEVNAIALGLTVAMEDKSLAAKIRNALKAAFAGTPNAVAIASALRHAGDFGGAIPGEPEPSERQRYIDMWRYKNPSGRTVTVGSLMRVHLRELRDGEDIPGAELMESALDECDLLTLRKSKDGNLWPVNKSTGFDLPRLRSVLSNSDAAAVLELCTGSLEPAEWPAQSLLARVVWSALSREPVGMRLGLRYVAQGEDPL